MSEGDAAAIMYNGRHMYMSVDDRCGPPYTVVFDFVVNHITERCTHALLLK